MFKVITDRQFNANVEVFMPVDGGHEMQTFICRYRIVGAEEADKHDLRTGTGTVAVLKLAIVKFGDDLVDENEKPLPYNDALRDAMLDVYPIRQALISAYLSSITKATAGN